MPIPPQRAPSDVGHVGDHNDIADVLTAQEALIGSVDSTIDGHIVGADPHGDRAYADGEFSPLAHTHTEAVQSVNGQTGVITLAAVDVGAVSTGVLGLASGVATLDSGGKLLSAQLPSVGINSTVTIANTVTEAALCAYTIPAGSAVQGDTYRITMVGSVDIGTGAGTLTFRVRIGGVGGTEIGGVVWTLASSALATRPFWASFDVLVAGNASASTTLKCGGHAYNNVVTTGQGALAYGSGTSDLTTGKDLAVTGKWSVADAAHILRAEAVTIEKVR
jgi:hypothetical protein